MINGAPAIVHLDRNKTPRQRAADMRKQPRSGRRPAGGFIADLVALKRAIVLCGNCWPKFDMAKNGYIILPEFRMGVIGKCDGCQEHGDRRHFMYHKDAIPH